MLTREATDVNFSVFDLTQIRDRTTDLTNLEQMLYTLTHFIFQQLLSLLNIYVVVNLSSKTENVRLIYTMYLLMLIFCLKATDLFEAETELETRLERIAGKCCGGVSVNTTPTFYTFSASQSDDSCENLTVILFNFLYIAPASDTLSVNNLLLTFDWSIYQSTIIQTQVF